ncbi:MAG TPA: dihydrolipoamide acetyltransferase family protein, partial [Ktedonobacterales bacterium]|nr:dihydrolipoamide acetyltransferase family protein [Ktedonobacterales bacterium]
MSQFLLPDLGEGLEEAQLVQWLVQVGDAVHLNQPLCQVETAKALVDIPSPFAGTVARLHAEPGDTVPVGAPLVTIEETGAARPAGAGDGHGPVLVGYGTEGPAQTFTRRRRIAAAATASAAPAAATAVPTEASPSASPLVRKMAAERGIDLATIQGTGPGGRIRVEDLAAEPAAAPAQQREPAADEERISTIGLRKAIAARMVRAATTIPHFTEYSLFDASALVALRNQLKGDPAYADQHLTVTPFFVRALVEAVKAHPIMNSRWDEEGNAIVVKHSIHVGIATDTPRGLLVPVVANAHALTLAQLAAECDRLVRLAREGTLD